MRPMKDPAPSRLSYRLNRLMLRRGMRGFVRFGLPFCIALAAGVLWLADDVRRDALWSNVEAAKRYIEERPEFMVHMMAVEQASDPVNDAIRNRLHLDFPVSSFDLDLEALKKTIEEIPAVRSAALHVRSGGVLAVNIEERQPAVVWRKPDGLVLLDVEGQVIGTLLSRSERSDLPLIVGEGAAKAVPEALSLYASAAGFHSRVRALQRIGERRWDVVLDRGQRIMLPEAEALSALERMIALDSAQDLLARDISHIDFRNARRPVLRMAETAIYKEESPE